MQANLRMTVDLLEFAPLSIAPTMPDRSPSTAALIQRAAAELAAFRVGGPSSGEAGMELMRRAFQHNEARAWEGVQLLFLPQLASWVRQAPAFPGLGEEDQDLALQALERTRRSLSPQRFAALERLEQVLRILKLAVHCVVIDQLRARQRTEVWRAADPGPDEEMQDLVDRSGRQSESPDGIAAARGFWQQVAKQLRDESERVVVQQSYMLDLPPREIARLNPHLFKDAAAVNRVKENVLRRLRRWLSDGGSGGSAARRPRPHP